MARTVAFPTIRTEGGLLPTDLLTQVVAGSLPGMTAEADYHLPAREKLNEAVSRSWNRLLAAWTAFSAARSKLAAGDLATTETRERWLLPLFSELGYGRLAPAHAVDMDGRTFPISHEWGSIPIHLVGAGVKLDERTRGVAGAARMSPHGLVQDLLNISQDRLWGFVSNGLQLRILRDSEAITRQAYLEFDLEEMMDGEVYSDFVVLWLIGHQSRLEGERPSDCWLEKWSQYAIEQGTRALSRLREGVEAAITALGRGYLSHPANRQLRDSLRSGHFDRQAYYRELLRIVYRLIFLMVAEDRDLLHPPDTPSSVRTIYSNHYSATRMRRLAERRRGSAHADLYEVLTLVMNALGKEGGLKTLGLPALGSFLWRTDAVAHLASCQLRNRDLLEAIAALAFTTEGRVRRAVDYRNLGSEELGSVYESLLELHPEVNLEAATFSLTTAGGHERKLTGSYYTPTSLITSLLDSTLDPILAEATSETAILGLKVVDPACGSGHFLIAAAHRIAKKLAAIRTGDIEPAPGAVRHALRDVISHCVFGVDMNDMAVELCKVSLWMETLDPGRPLSFLDNRIVLGNSLLGATPALLRNGIPDDAFKPIEGDDPESARSWKRRNHQEVAGQTLLAFEGERVATEIVGQKAAELDALPDQVLSSIVEKERRYEELIASSEIERARLAADAWCAAFVAPKVPAAAEITEDLRQRLLSNPDDKAISFGRTAVQSLADDYRFMHWHLAFPNVFAVPSEGDAGNPTTGWSGGFDLVLGNPPWDRVKLQEQEWFAERDREIAELTGARRRKRVAELITQDPTLNAAYRAAARRSEGISHLLRDSGRFPLCGHGDVNTYSVFAELMRSLLNPRGQAGIVVPTGIATDDTTKEFFADLVESRSLASLYDFENQGIFPAVDSRYKFCLLTMSGPDRPVEEGAEFVFFARAVSDLADQNRRFRLTAQDLHLLNPNTRTCPTFRTRRDAEIVKTIYATIPVLLDRSRGSSWDAALTRMFDMTNDSALFLTRDQLEGSHWKLNGNVFKRGDDLSLPLYEGKMLDLFDHRAAHVVTSETAIVRQGQSLELTSTEHADPKVVPIPRYWIEAGHVAEKIGHRNSSHALLAIRKVTSPTNERTVIATLLPIAGVGDSAQVLFAARDAVAYVFLAACMSSFALDFVARNKVGGINLNFFIIEQLPVPALGAIKDYAPWDLRCSVQQWFAPRLAELYCTAVDMVPLAHELGFSEAPFRWDDTRRQLIRAEVDAAFFHLYGFAQDEVRYAMDTFPIIRRKDEQAYAEYRTQRLILERYDAMAQSSLTGEAYATVLDPPPAHPSLANFPYAMNQ
jgi:hypothetical protein